MFGKSSDDDIVVSDVSDVSYISDETIEKLAFHYLTEIEPYVTGNEPPTPEKFATKYVIAYKKIKQEISYLKKHNFS